MNDQILVTAAGAFRRHCRSMGVIAAQPSASASTVDANNVTLRNGRGVLAKYRFSFDGLGRLQLTQVPISDADADY